MGLDNERLRDHLITGNHSNVYLKNAIKKYGLNKIFLHIFVSVDNNKLISALDFSFSIQRKL